MTGSGKKKDTLRGRNPGHSIFGGRVTRTDAIADRPVVVRDLELAWDKQTFTREEANALGLVTREDMSRLIGWSGQTFKIWSQKYDDFPKPKGLLRYIDNGRNYLYNIDEVARWVVANQKARRIREPQKRKK